MKYMQLQEKFNSVEEERNGYRTSIHEATSEACKDDMMEHDFLQENLERVSENNAIIEQHLHHIVSSAGIDKVLKHFNTTYMSSSKTTVRSWRS